MKTPTSAEHVAKIAEVADYWLEPNQALRIAAAIGPALAKFGEVEATLPFEAEPADFRKVQIAKGTGQ